MARKTLEDVVNGLADTYNLSSYEHLNLYLVVEGIMPAAYINFHIKEERSKTSSRINDFNIDSIKSEREKIKRTLRHKLGLNTRFAGLSLNDYFCMGHKEIYTSVDFSVSRDSYKNKEHMYAEDDYKFGIASGFPLPAVLRYSYPGDQSHWYWYEVRDIRYDALKKNPEKHIEQAYLLWVPEGIDRESGDIAPTSRQKCIEIMNFVRKNNPKLAKKMEDEFLSDLKD